MTKTYRIALDEYDQDGTHFLTRQLFSDLIAELETDYHRTMRPLRANVLTGNARVLLLLESCFVKEADETFGMDLIDGELNMDVNLKMDAHSKRTMVYAIGSRLKGNEDEPLFLVRDDSLSDRVVELGHRSDMDDDGPEAETPSHGTGEEWETQRPRKPLTAEQLNRPLPTPEEVQAFLDHLCACGIVDEWMLRQGE